MLEYSDAEMLEMQHMRSFSGLLGGCALESVQPVCFCLHTLLLNREM